MASVLRKRLSSSSFNDQMKKGIPFQILRNRKMRANKDIVSIIIVFFSTVILLLIVSNGATTVNNYLQSVEKNLATVNIQEASNVTLYTDPINIHLVVAFCNSSMTWIHDDLIATTLKTFPQASFHMNIMSKCGREADIPEFNYIDAVKTIQIISIPNVGGCDYAYIKYLNDFRKFSESHPGPTNSETQSLSDVVLFLKDIPRTTTTFHHNRKIFNFYRDITEMITMALNETFVCGLDVKPSHSEYHHVPTLYNFTIDGYTRASHKNFSPSPEEFNPHGYSDLWDFHSRALKWEFPRYDYIRVCYGGTFAVPQHRIMSLISDGNITRVMELMEKSMSESPLSIAEHFIERTWAGLISKPLTEDESLFLKSKTKSIFKGLGAVYGALCFKRNKNLEFKWSKRSCVGGLAITMFIFASGTLLFRRGHDLWVSLSSLLKKR